MWPIPQKQPVFSYVPETLLSLWVNDNFLMTFFSIVKCVTSTDRWCVTYWKWVCWISCMVYLFSVPLLCSQMACVVNACQDIYAELSYSISIWKVHFIRDKNEGSICAVSQSLDRISGSKKEKDLYVVCLLRHLSGSAWHCLKILDYHKEKVLFKKKQNSQKFEHHCCFVCSPWHLLCV